MATGSPNSLSHPLLLGEETERLKREPESMAVWQDPGSPRCPTALPSLSRLGLSGQPGVGFQHLELEIMCTGQPVVAGELQETGLFQRNSSELGEHFGELSEIREALLSSSSGGPKREAQSRQATPLSSGVNHVVSCPRDRPLSAGCWAHVAL